MAKTLNTKLQIRNDVASAWASNNPVLMKGEMGIESDTKKFKFGDGTTNWNDLGYASTDEVTIDAALSADSENPVQNKVVNEAVHYTNETPIVTAIGSVKVGDTFDNMTIQDVLTKILYPYVKPTASISVSPNGGTYEKGTSVPVTSLKITAGKKSSAIASVVAKQGNTVITTLTDDVAAGGTFDVLPADGITLTANATFSAVVTDADNGSASANSSSFTFVDPYFYGVVAAGTTITSDVVLGLTKDIKGKGSKTYKYTTAGSCMVIAYPAAHGNLKSALDPNKFENIASFTKHEVTVACTSGNVAYYVYVKEASTVTDFAITYSY